MAWCVRIFVQKDKVVNASIEDKGLLVIFFLQSFAKNAFLHLNESLNVFFSPWGGDVFHYSLIMFFISLLGLKYKTFLGGT